MSLEITHNEKELLSQVSGGDRDAFKQLYHSYFPHVQRYVSLFEPDNGILDELTQDVFVRIWEKRSKLSQVTSFKSYLFMATRNVVFNYIRAMKVRHRIGALDDGDTIAVDDQENSMLFKQYYHLAMEAIDKLPTGRRKILKMSIERGLTLDEIASELQISRSGVKKQLYTATAFVRQYLQDHGEITLMLFVFLSLFEY